MTKLTTNRTEHIITCWREKEWGISAPLSTFAPQTLIISGGTIGQVYIHYSEIDLFIEALTTIRDAMKEARP